MFFDMQFPKPSLLACFVILVAARCILRFTPFGQVVARKANSSPLRFLSPKLFEEPLRKGIVGVMQALGTKISDMMKASSHVYMKKAIPTIIESMAQHSNDLRIQLRGLRLMHNLSESTDCIPAIGRRGVNAIFAAMRRHKKSLQVMQHGCGCFSFLCHDMDMARYIVSKGGVEIMLDSLEHFQTDESVCADVFLAFCKLDSNGVRIDPTRCIDATCRAMATHKNSVRVQCHCAYFLTTLSDKEHPHSRICTSNCIVHIFAAIANHKGDYKVQTNAMLAAGHIGKVMKQHNPRAARQFFGTSVVDSVLHALALMKGDEWLESSAFKLLCFLAEEPANIDHMMQRDTLKFLFDILGKNREKELLVRFAHAVSLRDAETCKILVKLGVMEHLYNVQRSSEVPPELRQVFDDTIANLRNGGRSQSGRSEGGRSEEGRYEDSNRMEGAFMAGLEPRRRVKPPSFCTVCAKTAVQAGRKKLFKCGGCTLAPFYCSLECQRNHWTVHKKECKENPSSLGSRDAVECD